MKLYRVACFLSLGACAAPLPQASRQVAATARQQGDWNAAIQALQSALCANPQAHDAVDVARQLADAWAADGRLKPLAAALPCPVPQPLADVLQGLDAAAHAEWATADAALARAADTAPPPWRAALALRQAVLALHTGQNSAAARALQAARTWAPMRADVRLIQAQALLAAGDARGTVQALREVPDLFPTHEELQRGHELLSHAVKLATPPLTPAVSAALQEMASALQGPPLDSYEFRHLLALARAMQHPQVDALAALVALRQNEPAQAVRLLTLAQVQNPLDPGPSRLLGGHYFMQKNWLMALEPMRQAAHRDPFDMEVLALLAPTAAALGDLKTAAAAYTRLQRLEPQELSHKQALERVKRLLTDQSARSRSPLAPRCPAPPAPSPRPDMQATTAACD